MTLRNLGTNVAALNNAYVHPGAIVQAGETAAQIQAKADACQAAGTTLVIPDGTWTLDALVVFRCNAWALPGATFTGNIARLVQIGDDTTFYENLTIVLPHLVRQTKAWAAGSITTDQGLTIHRLNQSTVWVPHIKDFAEGMALIPTGGGAAYNKVFIGHLENNAKNQRLEPQTGGWVNDNQFFGGRYSHASANGSNVTGTRHIQVKNSSAFGAPNNNVWIGGSVEGDVAEYHLDVNAGSHNVLKSLRWEATTPKVRWGATALGNSIERGYGAENITFTVVSGASGNHWHTRHGSRMSSSQGKGVVVGTAGSTTPVFVTLTGGETLTGDPATEYLCAVFGDGSIRVKSKADVAERLRIDPATGSIWFGDGTATPTKKLRTLSTSLAIDGHHLVFLNDNTWDIGTGGGSPARPRYVRAATALQTGAGDTASRPSASTAGAGAVYFDTTLGRAVWSDGASWIDPLASVQVISAAYKAANTTRNNTATRADDPDLTLAVAANTKYIVEGWLGYESTTTADISVGWSGPSGATLVWSGGALTSSATATNSATIRSRSPLISSTLTFGGIGAGVPTEARPMGLLTVSSTAGAFALSWAQAVAEVSDAILYAGSWLRLTKVA